MKQVNTPGFCGYLVAFAFGTVVLFALTVPFTDVHHTDAMDVVVEFFVLALIAVIYSFGTALLQAWGLLFLVLLAMRRVERQWIHVLAAGLTAGLFGLLLAPAADRLRDRVVLVVALAVSMALGRLVVIPAVEDRRAKAGLR